MKLFVMKDEPVKQYCSRELYLANTTQPDTQAEGGWARFQVGVWPCGLTECMVQGGECIVGFQHWAQASHNTHSINLACTASELHTQACLLEVTQSIHISTETRLASDNASNM